MPLFFASASCLVGLMWGAQNLKLVPIGVVSAVSFIVQAVLRRIRRSLRMGSQLLGAFGLTATAPAAYYVASGRLYVVAFVLWVANWFFAASQIHFVHLCIHAFRAQTLHEKALAGKSFLIGQIVLLAAIGACLLVHNHYSPRRARVCAGTISWNEVVLRVGRDPERQGSGRVGNETASRLRSLINVRFVATLRDVTMAT